MSDLRTWDERKETALVEMKELEHTGDEEMAHIRADEILCELLVQLGCKEIVGAFEKVPKWYA